MATANDHIDFDLDGVLDMNLVGHPTTTTSDTKDSEQRIAASTTLVSSLPTVATSDGVCSVCMEDFQAEPEFSGKQIPCGHVFHSACISTWVSICNSCPLCRSRCIISGEDLQDISVV